MKFIHTADLHIGATPESGRPWARERKSAVETVLSRIVDLCNEEGVDLLFIAGDLFNRVPLKKDLKEVAYEFSRLKRAKVVIIAGNHDYLEAGSAYEGFDLGTHVKLITSESLDSEIFPELNTVVHGLSYHTKNIVSSKIDALKCPDDGKIHILLAHGGDAEHMPFNTSNLGQSGFDYIALGHIHQPKLFKGTHMAYSGSPEPLDNTDIGDRGCFIGEITKETFSLKWQSLAVTKYRREELELNPEMTEGEIRDRIKELAKKAPLDLLILKITGRYNPEISIDYDTVSSLGRICKIEDESVPDYDLDKLIAEHRDDLVGRFIISLKDNEDEVSKKALYYGLKVLL